MSETWRPSLSCSAVAALSVASAAGFALGFAYGRNRESTSPAAAVTTTTPGTVQSTTQPSVEASVDDSTNVDAIEAAFRGVQDHICQFLIDESGQQFLEDQWQYTKGSGGGITRVWDTSPSFATHDEAEDADNADDLTSTLIEKGGVNFSGIHGSALPVSAGVSPDAPFRATGVSLVIHPRSPHVPTIHANIRYFESGTSWWFGGGIDLTPYYVDTKMVTAFHLALRDLCEEWGFDYEAFKKQCDDYFVNTHRGNEARGVGGLFFDHLTAKKTNKTKQEICSFVVALGMLFPRLYAPFIHEGRSKKVTRRQRDFHLYRRSRYVEFNLLHDKGTKFGLQSSGRIESIFMSLPPLVRWKYNWQPEEGSEEAKLYEILVPKDWAGMEV